MQFADILMGAANPAKSVEFECDTPGGVEINLRQIAIVLKGRFQAKPLHPGVPDLEAIRPSSEFRFRLLKNVDTHIRQW